MFNHKPKMSNRNFIIPYNPQLKERARELRKNPTLAEKKLWRALRRRQLGYEFHRQVPIDQFIVDFYCHELLLVIEVDGSSHDSENVKARDIDRQSRIENLDISFLRFQDKDVLNNLDGVVGAIENWIEKNKKQLTSP